MTAHASEGTTVAQRASLLHDRFGGVSVVEIGRMVIRRLEIRPLGIMTLCTTERRVDLVVAHQTVGHLRHVGVGHMLRGIDSPMARQAGVRRIEMSPDVTRIRQVRFLVDRPGDYRRDIPQPQMLHVAEVGKWRSAGCPDRPARMTRLAIGSGRQQVLSRRRTRSGSGVTIGALLLELQVQLMRKLLTRKRADKEAQ